MANARSLASVFVGLLAGVAATTGLAGQDVDYRKAEQLLTWNTNNLVAGGAVSPQWMADGNRFWYRNNTGTGHEFVLVDPATNTRGELFDRHRMAAAMSLAADTAFDGTKLPFETFKFLRDESGIEFTANKKRFDCDVAAYVCQIMDTVPDARGFVVSPDSTWEVFAQEYNLYMRPYGGGDTIQLTTDGEEFYAYGLGAASPSQIRRETPRSPTVHWAPNSRRMLVTRPDERGVEMMHYISYTPQRPKHYARPYALPGDSIVERPGFHIIDISTTVESIAEGSADGPAEDPTNIKVDLDPLPFRLLLGGSASDSLWTSDSERIHATWYTRGAKQYVLGEVDASTGAAIVLAGDSSKTNVIGQMYSSSPGWFVTRDREDVFWWSERDGYAHLWRYDGEGNEKGQITSGPWTVTTIERVDEARRRIYFTARGREAGHNIYYTHLYSIGYDGSDLRLLTPEDANHEISFSPTGQYFVDAQSTITDPGESLLRRVSDGTTVRTLEEADESRLLEVGWGPAEIFSVKARDGVTDIYGLIYFPPDMDPEVSYPVIEHIYPGPFVGSVGRWSFKGGGENFALAQLGFIVVQVDHMGTPYRSKAFHDNYYGNMGDNGIPDHVAAIKQLAVRYPFMDLERVGIYGHSGGGFASTDAILSFPDFYKVAVSGAGNHDNRTYGAYWGETYQGLLVRDSITGSDNYANQSNPEKAKNLQGKLLLMHGDMDDNVHPAMTIQVVDELIKANRDFDLIIAPDRAHGLNEPYFIRRRWDYFVRHLMGAEPPAQYEITRPSG